MTGVLVVERLARRQTYGHVLRLVRVAEHRRVRRVVVGDGGVQPSVPVIGDVHAHHMHGPVVGDARQFA